MSKEEKEKQMFTHHLMCSKCGVKFSVDSEHRSNTELDLESMSCPICESAIQINPSMLPSSGEAQKSMSQRRKENARRSAQARAMANRQKEADRKAGLNKEISVKSYQKGKNKGKTMKVPKKVVNSIKEKVKDKPALQEED